MVHVSTNGDSNVALSTNGDSNGACVNQWKE